jgi:long-chain acyl-CoA synthetase
VLASLGVQPGDRVVQIAENSYWWIVCDLAIQMAQAIHVPLHARLAGEQYAWQVNHSGARVVLFQGAEQGDALAACAPRFSARTSFASFEVYPGAMGEQPVAHLAELTAGADPAEGARLEEAARAALTPDSLATILYTSGTTGEPKGVMLSHRNLVTNTQGTIEAFGLQEQDLRLSFLPLSHIFARTCDLYTWIARGSQLALAESRETILADCARIRPTMLNGVPFFYERVQRYLVEQGKADQPGSLRALLGGAIRLCCSGGAALPNDVFDFFQRHEIPLLQGYGLTETSPVITLTAPSAVRRGAVGRAIPGVEVAIAPDGEILTRGPHVMAGYWRDPEGTAQVLRDGWLHTGDIGRLDEDGFLWITGRKKELIVTSAGKNVAPAHLESLLTQDPLILQALVLGDGRDYLTALIVPDPVQLRAEMKARRIFALTRRGALRSRRVRELYAERIRRQLAGVSHFEQVRDFSLMDRGFTLESGELTPKLSLRRKVIEAQCADRIAAMYHPARARQLAERGSS